MKWRFFALAILLSVGVATAQTRASGKAVYDSIVALDKADAFDMEMEFKKENPNIFHTNPERFKKRIDLLDDLKRMSAEGDPVAQFYWGYYHFNTGQRFSRSANENLQEFAQTEFTEALSGFIPASKAAISAASWNIALMYQEGWGVTKSNLAAAEWYAKSGHQYLAEGDREKALAALESVEAIEKQHPDAKELRAALYPARKAKQR